MKIIVTGKIFFCAVLFFILLPLYGAEPPDVRSVPIEVNLIVDSSAALAPVLNGVTDWVSAGLLDRLQAGDKITLWSAGDAAEIVFQDTLKTAGDKENIQKALKSLVPRGEAADFAGALREAAAVSRAGTYTVLISASQAAFPPALAGLLRFSRVEKFKGWQAITIALGVEPQVRRAASAWLLGN